MENTNETVIMNDFSKYNLLKHKKIVLTEKYPMSCMEQRFLSLVQDLEIKRSNAKRYDESIFFFKGEECWFDLYFSKLRKHLILFCSGSNYWDIFRKEFNLTDSVIQDFTIKMMKKHLNIEYLLHLIVEENFSIEKWKEEHYKKCIKNTIALNENKFYFDAINKNFEVGTTL
jgi:hypothetical protein